MRQDFDYFNFVEMITERFGEDRIRSGERQPNDIFLDQRHLFTGQPEALLLPGSTAEVAAMVRLCRDAKVTIVTENELERGGRKPHVSGCVILSLAAMHEVRACDPFERTIEIEAGASVAAVRWTCEDGGLRLPGRGLDDTHSIGSLIAWNASPGKGMRHGTARDLVLGIEAVLADGTVVNSIRNFRGDIAGFDWKQLLVGTEDTLGIVTAAVMRLDHIPQSKQFIVALAQNIEGVARLYWYSLKYLGNSVQNVHVYSRNYVNRIKRFEKLSVDTEGFDLPWVVVVEAESAFENFDGMCKVFIEGNIKEKNIENTCISETAEEMKEVLWLRNHIQYYNDIETEETILQHEIRMPLRSWAEFIDAATQAIQLISPGARPHIFASLAESLIRYDVFINPDSDAGPITKAIRDMAAKFDGNCSEGSVHIDEDSVGLLKRVKLALDPANLLNPSSLRTAKG